MKPYKLAFLQELRIHRLNKERRQKNFVKLYSMKKESVFPRVIPQSYLIKYLGILAC